MKKFVARIGLLLLASLTLSTSVFAENVDSTPEEDASARAKLFCNSVAVDTRHIGTVGDWYIDYWISETVDGWGWVVGTHDCVQVSENLKTGEKRFAAVCNYGGGGIEMKLDE